MLLPASQPVPPTLPVLLSVVAGYVDGCTFVALSGLFVAQVTGSFVLVGAGVGIRPTHVAIAAMAVPIFFLAGVMTTMLAALAMSERRSPLLWALIFELALLSMFLIVGMSARRLHNAVDTYAVAAAMLGIAAMGAQSALVRLLMRGVASTNIMTTNISVFAIDVAALLLAWLSPPRDARARAQLAVAQARCVVLIPIMLAFLIGAAGGAAAFVFAGWPCLIVPIAVVGVIVLWASRHPLLRRRRMVAGPRRSLG